MRGVKQSSWAVEGADVAVFDGYDRFIRYGMIGKVHKTGNVVLNGDSQQYRVWGDGGMATGDGRSKDKIFPVTDEIRAKVKGQKDVYVASALLENMRREMNGLRGPEQWALAAKIIKGLGE